VVRRFDDAFFARQKLLFEWRRGGNGRKRRSDADDRAVEIEKSFLLDARNDFRTDTALFDSFMNYKQAAGFLYGLRDRFNIEGRDRARIDQFNGDSFARQFIGGRECRTDHARQNNDR